MRTTFLFAMYLLAFQIEASGGLVVQWKIQDGGNGHYYELVGNYLDPTQRWNWETSKTMAEGMFHQGLPGGLATITSGAENQFIVDNLVIPAGRWPTWIGLTDSEAFGGFESFGQPNPQVDGWRWVTSEPVTFVGWNPGNPDNTNNEDFALIGSQFGDHTFWNDAQGGTGAHAQFLVEYELATVPEPTTIAVWAWFALAAGLACARRCRFQGANA
jgi:hypothetical protein